VGIKLAKGFAPDIPVGYGVEEVGSQKPEWRRCTRRGAGVLADEKRCELDRLYQRVYDDLAALLRAVGLIIAA
jgi:hypothetical protein